MPVWVFLAESHMSKLEGPQPFASVRAETVQCQECRSGIYFELQVQTDIYKYFLDYLGLWWLPPDFDIFSFNRSSRSSINSCIAEQ